MEMAAVPGFEGGRRGVQQLLCRSGARIMSSNFDEEIIALDTVLPCQFSPFFRRAILDRSFFLFFFPPNDK